MTKLIPLTQGKQAIVDAEDYKEISRHKWAYHCNGYAFRSKWVNGKNHCILMHRVIAGTPSKKVTDHINGNKLDNRRSNLRVCTIAENLYNQGLRTDNKSGTRGVSWDSRRRLWRARANKFRKEHHIGRFSTLEEAVTARKQAVEKLYGDFSGRLLA